MGKLKKRLRGKTGAGQGTRSGFRGVTTRSAAYPSNIGSIRTGRCATSNSEGRWISGFTLIEVIGVLVVISILASVLIPVIFQVIHDARIAHAALTVQTVKTGCVEHFAKFGGLPVDGTTTPSTHIILDGTDPRSSEFDIVLLKESIMDKPFEVRIGFGYVEIVQSSGPTTQPDGANSAYDLDRTGNPNDATGATVAQGVIVGVALDDARALNNLIDGPALGENNGGNDFLGRVKYSKPGNGNSGNGNGNSGNGNGKALAWGHHRDTAADVFIYLTHH